MIKTNFHEIHDFYNNDNLSNYNFEYDEKILSDKGRLSDPIFKSIGYPSKIYYKNIESFIKSYTKEDAVVLDSCSGSGSTGLAALLLNRKALLVDNSPHAVNMAYNTLNYIDLKTLDKEYKKMVTELEPIINDLYSTETSDGKSGSADVIISSNSYSCPKCENEIVLYKNETGKRSEYKCNNCGEIINISKQEIKNRILKRRVPTEVKIKILDKDASKKFEVRSIIERDIELWNSKIEHYSNLYAQLWEPTEKIIYNRAYPRKGGWPGFAIDSTVKDLFPKSNWVALKIINDYIENKIENGSEKDFLKFVFTESLFRTSSRLFTTSGIKNVYHVPPLGKEQNVLTVFKRKYSSLIKGKKLLLNSTNEESIKRLIKIVKGNARRLDIPDESIDYAFIDPPYGGMVPYAELNLFYSAWLNEKEDLENEIIIPMDFEKKEGYVELWGNYIEQAFGEVYRSLKKGAYFTIVFHSKYNNIWDELRNIMTERLGFEFINIIENERDTTFHTNQINDTNPVSAFITYRKPEDGIRPHIEYSNKAVYDFFDITRLDEGMTFREIQSKLIFLAHEHNIRKIPSDKEILAWLKMRCDTEIEIFKRKK